MNDKHIRDLWNGLNGALYAVEVDRALGERADDELVLGLARRVIDGVSQLPEPSKRALRRREEAEAIVQLYAPLPQTAPAEQPPYTLTGMPSSWQT